MPILPRRKPTTPNRRHRLPRPEVRHALASRTRRTDLAPTSGGGVAEDVAVGAGDLVFLQPMQHVGQRWKGGWREKNVHVGVGGGLKGEST